jgi:Orn_aminotrans: ornithine--oxo-acid transaminase
MMAEIFLKKEKH